MVLLAGPALRIEHDACALSLYFCPLSAHAMHAQWGADECAAVRGRVHTAMKQLLLERLPLASLGPAIDAAAYAHRPPHGTLSAAAADKLLQRVASNILPIHPARSSGIPQETQTERCGRVVSAFMDTYETAIGLRGPSRDSIPVKAAHEWWADLNRMRALDSIEEPEKRHLLHIVQAYLAIPASSASCERSFSAVTRTRSTRPVMKPDLMLNLVFIKCNSWIDEDQ
jgi:hypothetical protein